MVEINRRKFLKLGGVLSTALAAPVLYAGSDREVREGFLAAVGRTFPDSKNPEIRYLSDEGIIKSYKKFLVIKKIYCRLKHGAGKSLRGLLIDFRILLIYILKKLEKREKVLIRILMNL